MANSNLNSYRYEAQSIATNRFVEGSIKAVNKQAVAEYLADLGYAPLTVNAETALTRDLSFGKKRVKPKMVAAFIRQLSTLTASGVPITRSLDLLRDQAENPTLQAAIADVRKSIDAGSTLAAAMEQHPTIFQPLVISMIRAGEIGGFLEETLDNVATTLESDVRLRGEIKAAMTYPVVVLAFAAIAVVAMLLFIVPIFKGLYDGLGGQLPLPTQFLVLLGDWLRIGIIPIVIGLAAFTAWWRKNKHREGIRRFLDPIKLKLPIFGNLMQKIMLTRFARNFAALLSAGLPVMQVMDIVGSTSGSTVMEDAMQEAKKGVAQGEMIAPQLAKHAVFPRTLTEMLAIGEDGGSVPEMMSRIAAAYDDEVTALTKSLSSLMEPILIAILGTIIGGLVVALYLPIFNIQEVISNS